MTNEENRRKRERKQWGTRASLVHFRDWFESTMAGYRLKPSCDYGQSAVPEAAEIGKGRGAMSGVWQNEILASLFLSLVQGLGDHYDERVVSGRLQRHWSVYQTLGGRDLQKESEKKTFGLWSL